MKALVFCLFLIVNNFALALAPSIPLFSFENSFVVSEDASIHDLQMTIQEFLDSNPKDFCHNIKANLVDVNILDWFHGPDSGKRTYKVRAHYWCG